VYTCSPLRKGWAVRLWWAERYKYEFLGVHKTYPVIVSDKLSPEENEKLLILLKKHRKVIGYSINDLKGLSPAFCTHRIPMEDQCKPVVDHQRRLTHAM
jgi:hypothetical protein